MTASPGFRPSVESRLVDLVQRRGLSTRAAVSAVRSEGYRISNDRARGLVNLARGREVTGLQRRALGITGPIIQRGRERVIRATYSVVAPIIAQFQGRGGRTFSTQPQIRGERTITVNVQGFRGRQTLIAAFQRDFANVQTALAREAAARATGVTLRYLTDVQTGTPRIELIRQPTGSRRAGSTGPVQPPRPRRA